VVLDTAPTGHSLLLMDATGAYHRQMVQQYEGKNEGQAEGKGLHIITPLMRLQDGSMTRVIIVTLPEVTPVSQAAALQDDLRRAQIEPWAWVINKSIAATGTTDPLLQARHYVKTLQELGGKHPTLPPCIDIETPGLGRSGLNQALKVFLGEIFKLTGRSGMIYVSPGFWNSYLPVPVLSNYKLTTSGVDWAPSTRCGWRTTPPAGRTRCTPGRAGRSGSTPAPARSPA
jgi:hypothetical protein